MVAVRRSHSLGYGSLPRDRRGLVAECADIVAALAQPFGIEVRSMGIDRPTTLGGVAPQAVWLLVTRCAALEIPSRCISVV